MKLRLHPTIPKPIDLELKSQPRALDNHLEREIQIVKLDPARGSQACEEALGHGAQIGGQRADVDEVAGVGRGRVAVGVRGDEVVGYD